MTTHVNFYENLAEAQMRLRNTIVLYDKEPCYVRAICNHKGDGVFRIYVEPLANLYSRKNKENYNLYSGMEAHPYDSPTLGTYIDEYLNKNKDTGLMRKKMNSPLFNRFRPFPLGMVNVGEDPSIQTPYHGRCYYMERQPARSREQGLTVAMIDEAVVGLGAKPVKQPYRSTSVSLYSACVEDMIRGKYPSVKEAYEALSDPDVSNESIAFHRNFALIRGPVGTMFLGYKDKVIGQVEDKAVTLGKEFRHLKEVTQELNAFDVKVR